MALGARRIIAIPLDIYMVGAHVVSMCHRGEKDRTCLQSVFAEEGNQYKVSVCRWSGVLLAVQTVQLCLWYVKHFIRKRVDKTATTTKQPDKSDLSGCVGD